MTHDKSNRRHVEHTPESVREFIDESGGPTACHPWRGYIARHGYGSVHFQGRKLLAHRLVWELRIGPIPDGMVIGHICDNKACCNLNHLFLGTQKANMFDMSRKQRAAIGERANNAVLTEDQVLQIRSRYRPYSKADGFAAIARELGVSPHAVQQAARGVNWKHVDGAVPFRVELTDDLRSRMRSIRERLGETRAQFASRLNATVPMIEGWELGYSRRIDVATMERLTAVEAEFCGMLEKAS